MCRLRLAPPAVTQYFGAVSHHSLWITTTVSLLVLVLLLSLFLLVLLCSHFILLSCSYSILHYAALQHFPNFVKNIECFLSLVGLLKMAPE